MATRLDIAQLHFPLGPEVAAGPDTSSTFQQNLSLPLHRWFRFSAGFSALWARQVIEQHIECGRKHILDPFAGSGTVLFEAELAGVQAIGVEAHPVISRITNSKLLWRTSADSYYRFAQNVLSRARKYRSLDTAKYPPLIHKCYTVETLAGLDALRRAWEASADGSPESELTWLTLVSILRQCSSVGTAQWQYVLPNKTKANAIAPFVAFQARADLFRNDMLFRQSYPSGPQANLFRADARDLQGVPDHWADLVITSPPYANNYDYADATRLEMTFFGDIAGWGDLQDSVRKYLIRSCTQHAAPLNGSVPTLLADPSLSAIQPDITRVCDQLALERGKHGGNKPYHAMIAAYFYDMAQVFSALRRVTARGGLMCFVIGDSAPYGIYVPVEQWLGQLAVATGFKKFTFEKTRDRNIKWKNRKHRVPLHEGRLWIDA